LHGVLDIAFREDESRICTDHAPQNMATLGILRIDPQAVLSGWPGQVTSPDGSKNMAG
jgi:hypothetical protein